MNLKIIEHDFTVCKVKSTEAVDLSRDFCFAAKTDEEISLVCKTADTPADTVEREDGWRAFRIEGVLDFSLIGILAPIASLMADSGIGIFAVSTYNTDYVLIKKESFNKAVSVLSSKGYNIING